MEELLGDLNKFLAKKLAEDNLERMRAASDSCWGFFEGKCCAIKEVQEFLNGKKITGGCQFTNVAKFPDDY